VLAAAMDVFWENGYEGTAVAELEARTGLNRSSLYLEFGSKRELFTEALDRYYDEVTDPLLTAMEAGTDLTAIETFFMDVKRIIQGERTGGRRGCLLVNTIAELSVQDDPTARRGRAFRDRLHGAFRRVLAADPSTRRLGDRRIDERASMLAASTMGIWLWARVDLDDAAARCDQVAAEVRTWAPPGDGRVTSSRRPPRPRSR
jgi:TetR/AcrR family transcriptional repressor of nem operon